LASTKELLTSDPRGATAYIDADLTRPQTILRDPALRDTLDLSRPIALMLVSVLHFVTDDDVALRAVHTLVDAMPSCSYLVLSHATDDFMPRQAVDGIAEVDRATRVNFGFRSRERIARFAQGLEVAEPGVVSTAEWRPEPADDPLPSREDTAGWCLVARKP
jgi:hypothetical protein